MSFPEHIRGILFDLDGVLYVDTRPIAGAADAVRRVKNAGWPCRFVTNTSTLSLEALYLKLVAFDLPIAPAEIISAPQAALRHLRRIGTHACCLLMAEDVLRDFAEVRQTEVEQADVIVLGDIGDRLDYSLLNRIFNRMMQGADLVAIHRNRFWQTEHGLRMDIGGFIAALEYCTGRPAVVMGKPSRDFFGVALRDMDLNADQVALIGDDLESDVGGAQASGMCGILVRTGKFRQAVLDSSTVRPDAVIDSVAALPDLLGIP